MPEDPETFETQKVDEDEMHYIPTGEMPHKTADPCACHAAIFVGGNGILVIHNKYESRTPRFIPKKWYT